MQLHSDGLHGETSEAARGRIIEIDTALELEAGRRQGEGPHAREGDEGAEGSSPPGSNLEHLFAAERAEWQEEERREHEELRSKLADALRENSVDVPRIRGEVSALENRIASEHQKWVSGS